MTSTYQLKYFTSFIFLVLTLQAQSFETLLPPLQKWHGKSEALIANSNNPWQSPSEKTGLTDSPSYIQTFNYIDRLIENEHQVKKISIGKSPQGRDIWMLVISNRGASTPQQLSANNKPTLLVQAGIHSGEIDGKDAGLMLLRDILKGDKKNLIENVNWLFVPILNVDGHERASPFNRVNQRGPKKMGWRTNAENLNLNRDYTKLETPELRAMIEAINIWQPDLYFDVHVTDGEDYQYDITYGFNLPYGASPNISKWLSKNFKPELDSSLKENGHLAGPLTFGIDPMDFSKGIVGWTPSPRFSNGYGDYRHLATILWENHSLKPYKQRVLGTYIFLEKTLKLLANKGKGLIDATNKDKAINPSNLTVAWQINMQEPTSMDYHGIEYKKQTDPLTGLDYIEWLGKSKLYKDLPIYWMNKAKETVKVPKSYWIPAQYNTVIEKLKSHGINFKVHTAVSKINGKQLTIKSYEFGKEPFEARQMPTAKFSESNGSFLMPKGSVEVKTNQAFGVLAVALLDPRATDSFFAWGYFNSIFQRTEYIESYVLIPLAKKLFSKKPELKILFDKKKNEDEAFSKDAKKQMQWIYSQTQYFDKEYLKYPVIFEF